MCRARCRPARRWSARRRSPESARASAGRRRPTSPGGKRSRRASLNSARAWSTRATARRRSRLAPSDSRSTHRVRDRRKPAIRSAPAKLPPAEPAACPSAVVKARPVSESDGCDRQAEAAFNQIACVAINQRRACGPRVEDDIGGLAAGLTSSAVASIAARSRRGDGKGRGSDLPVGPPGAPWRRRVAGCRSQRSPPSSAALESFPARNAGAPQSATQDRLRPAIGSPAGHRLRVGDHD